jgi:group I intron endonuclease
MGRIELMWIYVVTNSANGKRYVGQTRVSVTKRWKAHVAAASEGQTHALARAIRKYGQANFSITCAQLPPNSDQLTLDVVERRLIAHLGTLVPVGYNLKEGGCGGPFLETTKAKISAALLGHEQSAETRQKISASKRGHRLGPQSSAHRASIQRGRVGFVLSDAAREKIRSTLSGRKLSEQHRENIRAAKVGAKRKPMSIEGGAALSAARKGRRVSEQTKQKLSAALKNFYSTNPRISA